MQLCTSPGWPFDAAISVDPQVRPDSLGTLDKHHSASGPGRQGHLCELVSRRLAGPSQGVQKRAPGPAKDMSCRQHTKYKLCLAKVSSKQPTADQALNLSALESICSFAEPRRLAWLSSPGEVIIAFLGSPKVTSKTVTLSSHRRNSNTILAGLHLSTLWRRYCDAAAGGDTSSGKLAMLQSCNYALFVQSLRRYSGQCHFFEAIGLPSTDSGSVGT